MSSSVIDIWAVICSTNVIGRYFFEVTVTGESYKKMFNDFTFSKNFTLKVKTFDFNKIESRIILQDKFEKN